MTRRIHADASDLDWFLIATAAETAGVPVGEWVAQAAANAARAQARVRKPELMADIVHLHGLGYNDRQIGPMVGCSYEYVRKVRNAHGLAPIGRKSPRRILEGAA